MNEESFEYPEVGIEDFIDNVLYDKNEVNDGWVMGNSGKIYHCGFEGHFDALNWVARKEQPEEFQKKLVELNSKHPVKKGFMTPKDMRNNISTSYIHRMGIVRIATAGPYMTYDGGVGVGEGELEFEYDKKAISSSNLEKINRICSKVKEEMGNTDYSWKITRYFANENFIESLYVQIMKGTK